MRLSLICCFLAVSMVVSCAQNDLHEDDFRYLSEKFADVQILRYKVPGFEELTLQQKTLLYYLYKAALSGRDIIYDQNYRHNLTIRRTLEAIVQSYSGDRSAKDFRNFLVYAKRVWFSNGIHHHYSSDKILPEFSPEYFAELVVHSPNGDFPLKDNESHDAFVARLLPIIFDPAVDAKRVNNNPNTDLVTGSANNYYEGVTQPIFEIGSNIGYHK